MDRLVKRLPPRGAKLESDLGRWYILELTDGTPPSVIVVDIISSSQRQVVQSKPRTRSGDFRHRRECPHGRVLHRESGREGASEQAHSSVSSSFITLQAPVFAKAAAVEMPPKHE